MPRQVIAQIFLVCAILLAQQTALAHDFWHASGAATQGSKSPEGKKLCHLHDLLGNVLGAVSVAPAQTPLLSFSDVGFRAAAQWSAQSRPLAPQSRGPPVVS